MSKQRRASSSPTERRAEKRRRLALPDSYSGRPHLHWAYTPSPVPVSAMRPLARKINTQKWPREGGKRWLYDSRGHRKTTECASEMWFTLEFPLAHKPSHIAMPNALCCALDRSSSRQISSWEFRSLSPPESCLIALRLRDF